MNRQGIARIVAVLVGAAVLFGLELGFGLQFYFAIPAGVIVYVVTRLTLDQMLGTDRSAK